MLSKSDRWKHAQVELCFAEGVTVKAYIIIVGYTLYLHCPHYITDNVTFQHLLFGVVIINQTAQHLSQTVITLPVNLHLIHLPAVYGPKTMTIN